MKDSDWALPVVAAIACIAFLLIATFVRLPYGAYTLLRILVCTSSGWWVFIADKNRNKIWAFALFVNAVLFNPIIPIYLRRSQWKAVDLADSVFFAMWLAYFFQSEKKQRAQEAKANKARLKTASI